MIPRPGTVVAAAVAGTVAAVGLVALVVVPAVRAPDGGDVVFGAPTAAAPAPSGGATSPSAVSSAPSSGNPTVAPSGTTTRVRTPTTVTAAGTTSTRSAPRTSTRSAPTRPASPTAVAAVVVTAAAPVVDVAADGVVTISAAVTVSRTTTFQALQLAVRGRGDVRDDAAGVTLDLGFRYDTTVTGRTVVDGERTYAPGTYVVYAAWTLADGRWRNGPRTTFTVP